MKKKIIMGAAACMIAALSVVGIGVVSPYDIRCKCRLGWLHLDCRWAQSLWLRFLHLQDG